VLQWTDKIPFQFTSFSAPLTAAYILDEAVGRVERAKKKTKTRITIQEHARGRYLAISIFQFANLLPPLLPMDTLAADLSSCTHYSTP
jgi:hypothetical protein